jgi:asparagine synthase (glutamine-hydrolysing)
MCGIAGMSRARPGPVSFDPLRRMAAALSHRGPDGDGVEVDDRSGLAHVRLSVLDFDGGAQPMALQDGRLSLVYNGEIFNQLELRRELEARGHRFRSRTDTEVVLRGWSEWGPGLLSRLNGQFAFAIADRASGALILARDRYGILPLFYTRSGDTLYFASEAKALFATGEVDPAIDPAGMDQIFTFWAARAPRTPFRGVRALEPGCWARWQEGRLEVRRWYLLDLAAGDEEPPDAEARLDHLLRSAVDQRLQADVAVGAYLSGGLDSSITTTLASRIGVEPVHTFSVAFEDPRFDESPEQLEMARWGSTVHEVERVSAADIAQVFPEVVRHAETPLVRTAPAPLYLLSRRTREHGIKVVLSGEGADELFGGYDLFKDTAVRLFCLRQPDSRLRPRLFDRLYPHDAPGGRGGEFWRRYFLDAAAPEDPLFSHLPRFRLTEWIKGFYSRDFVDQVRAERIDPLEELRAELPAHSTRWTPLARAAYLEMVTLLPGYLLSSQGDRMAMAHGVELRVPFLDHRVVEFAARLPDRSKLRGLRDKALLRRWAARILPPAVARRPKRAYRAPDVPPFIGPHAPGYVADLLTPASLRRTGIFDPDAVQGLVRRCRGAATLGTRESQALVAIISTELWHHAFLRAPAHPPILQR